MEALKSQRSLNQFLSCTCDCYKTMQTRNSCPAKSSKFLQAIIWTVPPQTLFWKCLRKTEV